MRNDRSALTGSALTIALIVGLVTTMLAGALLAVAAADARQSGAVAARAQAVFAAEAGVSEVLAELNRRADIDGDGIEGSIASRQAPRSLPGAGGEYYVERVEQGTSHVVTARGAVPAFDAPGSVEVTVEALLAPHIPWPGGEAAVTVGGDPDRVQFRVHGHGHHWQDHHGHHHDPGTAVIDGRPADLPAILVQAPFAYDQIMESIYRELRRDAPLVLQGSPVETYVTDRGHEATAPVVQDDSLVFDVDLLNDVRQGLIEGANDLAVGADLTLTSDRDFRDPQTWGTPEDPQVTVIDANKVDIRAPVTGSGTLIVYGDLDVRREGSLTWDGDVLIVGNGRHRTRLSTHGGAISVTGNVAVLGDGHHGDVELHLHGDHGAHPDDLGDPGRDGIENTGHIGTLDVRGSVIVLGDTAEDARADARMKIHKHSEVSIDGLVLFAGNRARLDIHNHAHEDENGGFVLNGQLAIGVEQGRRRDELRIRLDGQTQITFDQANVDRAIRGLDTLASRLLADPPTFRVAGWVERR